MEDAALASTFFNVLIGRYSTVAALTVLLYDYFATLDEEVRLVWLQKFSLSHVLFYLNRYTPFLSVTIACYYILVEDNFDYCQHGLVVFLVFCMVGLLSAEFVFLLRADAVWGQRRSLRASLIVVFFVASTGCTYFLAKHAASVRIIRVTFSSGCLYSFGERDWAFMLMFAACDLLAFILLLTKRHTDGGLASTALMRSMYQESLMYFGVITALTAVNLVMEITAPSTLLDDFIVPEGILINILCSRMLLGIRRVHDMSCKGEALL